MFVGHGARLCKQITEILNRDELTLLEDKTDTEKCR